MPYLISALAAAVSVTALLTVLLKLRGRVRRFADTARRSRAHVSDRTRRLNERITALRVALHQRSRRNGVGSRLAAAA